MIGKFKKTKEGDTEEGKQDKPALNYHEVLSDPKS